MPRVRASRAISVRRVGLVGPVRLAYAKDGKLPFDLSQKSPQVEHMRSLIKHVLASPEAKDGVVVKGWVRTRRDSKGFSFLELNDGSCLANLQIVVDTGTPGSEHIAQLTTGASAAIEGKLVPSPAAGQKWELRARRVELVGAADAAYPLQKKGH